MNRAKRLGGSWILLPLAVASLAAADPTVSLLEAVKNADAPAVRAALEQGDVNVPEADGTTALHWAVHRDDLETARLLILAGARASTQNTHGVTPLWLAATNGSVAMVEVLLEAGADPNASAGFSGGTPLMVAARAGSVGAVKALLARGAQVDAAEPVAGQNALMWAVAERHGEVARMLIASGANVSARSKSGFTPLLFAARAGDLEGVRLLLAAGASSNEASADGTSVLIVATVRGHVELATFLLEQGADPNADGAGYTALHWAAGSWETMLSGPSFGIVDDSDPEWHALAGLALKKLEFVKTLLAHGADPNARLRKNPPEFGMGAGGMNLVGGTPFLLATRAADLDLMRFLVAKGADPLVATNQKTTPTMVAAGIGWDEDESPVTESMALDAVKLTLELGNEVGATNQSGQTALHGAAARGANSLVRLLVEKGADVNATDKEGITPLRFATEKRIGTSTHEDTAEVLRELGAK